MLSWADFSFLSVRLARAMADSICFLSARDSFFFGTGGCLPSLSACRFFFPVNNVIHLLVEFCLPFQHGIEVIGLDRKSTRLNSSHVSISYAVFCLKKKKNRNKVKLLIVIKKQ